MPGEARVPPRSALPLSIASSAPRELETVRPVPGVAQVERERGERFTEDADGPCTPLSAPWTFVTHACPRGKELQKLLVSFREHPERWLACLRRKVKSEKGQVRTPGCLKSSLVATTSLSR